MLFHVTQQVFFAGGFEATNAAAEEQHAVLHAGGGRPGRGAAGGARRLVLAGSLGRGLCGRRRVVRAGSDKVASLVAAVL